MEDSVDIGFDDVSVVEAKDFIDYNYELGTFRPWACESILRKLGIQIQGIPRPDVPNYIHGKLRKNSLQESNEEKSHGLQHQVFERLSRFSQLEKLMLGHYNSDYGNDYCYEDYPDGSMVYVDPSFQYECLDLSLRSGLTQLHTLKKLRFLGCARMSTNIGTDEIDWMVANWPLLAIVVGFKGNEEARKHLKTRYPEIEHELYYSYNG
ncbi:hypothetical protein FBU30_008306 [Linnemannia zychae]|nr:hypothetical protein FBU30_008306 [Linnemannia zychae]